MAATAGCAPRFATPRTPGRKTWGGRMAVVSEALGAPFMPWQQQVADVIGEIDENGHMAYREYRITVPRQSGKTRLILAKLTTRCLSAPMMNVVYTAQTYKDAKKKFVQEQIPLLNHSPIFAGMFVPHYGSGETRITWNNDSRHSIDAVTEKAGHGGTLDDGVIDEAFAQEDARVEQSMRPAMSTRPDAQLGVVSTAGSRKTIINADGEEVDSYLWGKVKDGRSRALAGQNRGVAYFEWSAADGMDPDDPATWLSCMPALGFTQSIKTIQDDRDGLKSRPGEFERAYLNLWPGDVSVVQVIPEEDWKRCADHRPGDPSLRNVWAVEVSENRDWFAIGMAARDADGRELVELVKYQNGGTAGAVPLLKELRERHGREDDVVGVDPTSPAGSLIPDLEDAGFTVLKLPATAKAQACGAFYDSATVQPPRLAHRNDAVVNRALGAAVKKKTGTQAWVWDAAASLLDISPVMVLTWARWALTVTEDEWYDDTDSTA